VNVESVEVFFDATDPMLVAFVDALIAFEARQEFSGKAFVGYASLRFTGPTSALIGMQRAPLTCAVEVSGLKDVTGSAEMVAFAESLGLNRNFGGILHWGQRNNSTSADVEHRFGDRADAPGGPLGIWRSALSSLTDNGRLDGCSSAFTRRTGLEVVQPVIGQFSSTPDSPLQGNVFTLTWDCMHNPPGTEVTLEIIAPDGSTASSGQLPLVGMLDNLVTMSGTYSVTLTAALHVSSATRTGTRALQVLVPGIE
jgi:hypothetical protein